MGIVKRISTVNKTGPSCILRELNDVRTAPPSRFPSGTGMCGGSRMSGTPPNSSSSKTRGPKATPAASARSHPDKNLLGLQAGCPQADADQCDDLVARRGLMAPRGIQHGHRQSPRGCIRSSSGTRPPHCAGRGTAAMFRAIPSNCMRGPAFRTGRRLWRIQILCVLDARMGIEPIGLRPSEFSRVQGHALEGRRLEGRTRVLSNRATESSRLTWRPTNSTRKLHPSSSRGSCESVKAAQRCVQNEAGLWACWPADFVCLVRALSAEVRITQLETDGRVRDVSVEGSRSSGRSASLPQSGPIRLHFAEADTDGKYHDAAALQAGRLRTTRGAICR